MTQQFTDFYSLLAIPYTATSNDVKKAYKVLALHWHPDKNPYADTTAKFQQLQRAVDTLSNPTTRARHDQELRTRGLLPKPAKPQQETKVPKQKPTQNYRPYTPEYQQNAREEWTKANTSAEEQRRARAAAYAKAERERILEEQLRLELAARAEREAADRSYTRACTAEYKKRAAEEAAKVAIKGALKRSIREWEGNWMKMLAFKQAIVAEYTQHLQSYLRMQEVCISDIKREQIDIYKHRRGTNLEKCTAEELILYSAITKKKDAAMLEHFSSFQKMTRTFEKEQAQLRGTWAQKYLMMIPAHDPVLLEAKVKDVFHSARKFWMTLFSISTSSFVEDDKKKGNGHPNHELDVSKLWYRGPPGTRTASAPHLTTDLETIHKLWDYKIAEGAWHKSSDGLIRHKWIPEPGEHICGRCNKLTTHSTAKSCEMVACSRCQLELVMLRKFETWIETEEMAWGPEPDLEY
ncbi:hypothetical protein ACMFMF_010770 [Clarireedia jacksonii]